MRSDPSALVWQANARAIRRGVRGASHHPIRSTRRKLVALPLNVHHPRDLRVPTVLDEGPELCVDELTHCIDLNGKPTRETPRLGDNHWAIDATLRELVTTSDIGPLRWVASSAKSPAPKP